MSDSSTTSKCTTCNGIKLIKCTYCIITDDYILGSTLCCGRTVCPDCSPRDYHCDACKYMCDYDDIAELIIISTPHDSHVQIAKYYNDMCNTIKPCAAYSNCDCMARYSKTVNADFEKYSKSDS
jgi:hypothetical protein